MIPNLGIFCHENFMEYIYGRIVAAKRFEFGILRKIPRGKRNIAERRSYKVFVKKLRKKIVSIFLIWSSYWRSDTIISHNIITQCHIHTSHRLMQTLLFFDYWHDPTQVGTHFLGRPWLHRRFILCLRIDPRIPRL